jgi:sugar phosphate isomerase/epimerase
LSLDSSYIQPDRGHVRLYPATEIPGENGKKHVLTIALSVQAKEFPDRFTWAEDNSFALEYTPDPLHPELIREHVAASVERGTPVRFHTRFFGYEMGNTDFEKAEEAYQVHSQVIEAMSDLGEPVVTVHLNLDSTIPFDPHRAVDNLSRLVEKARESNITVCLENLRRGPTSDPNNVRAWAVESGAMITMDIGHAVSSDYVKEGNMTAAEIVDLFSDRLYEAHMYGKEENRHYPVEDMGITGPIIDRLVTTGCRWWTIELGDYSEALDTRRKVLQYLAENKIVKKGKT